MKILIVEDEAVLREGLIDLLEGAGHEVRAVADGESAVAAAVAEPFDLILLDLMLPRLDGIEACHRIKQSRPSAAVLMLTARGSEEDKVRGLKNGADDYVTKPFGTRELLARIEVFARRRRATPAEPEQLDVDGCVLDLGRCEVRRNGSAVALTPREAGILRWLARHRSRAITRAELLEQVWHVPGHLETRTVDMAIAKLRQKIESDPTAPRIVVSVKGVGYAWGATGNGAAG